MSSPDTLTTIISLSLNRDWSLSLTINSIVIAIVLLLAILVVGIRWWFGKRPNFEIDAAEIGIGSHRISFKPNLRDQEIAYKIWVELSTRKIGLRIDLDHDVISEIYDSWHDFFAITRELIKDIPVNKAKNQSTQQIITLSIDVLNKGLRPHLTKWQARFRQWYGNQLEKTSDDIDPQALQAKYPKFKDLTKDLLIVNARLVKYREKMRELVLGLPKDQ